MKIIPEAKRIFLLEYLEYLILVMSFESAFLKFLQVWNIYTKKRNAINNI